MRAGMDVLLEAGWSGLTARAVATRAGANVGLIHYHFGGFPALRHEITAAVVADLFDDAVAVMTRQPGWREGLAAVIREFAPGVQGSTGTATGRLTADLVAASLQDALVRAQLMHALAETRQRLVPWLQDTGVPADQVAGTATLLVAALDGLLLHALVDPDLDLDRAAAAAERL